MCPGQHRPRLAVALLAISVGCWACLPASVPEHDPVPGPASASAGTETDYSIRLRQGRYALGVAQAQDTVRKLLRSLRAEPVEVVSPDGAMFVTTAFSFTKYSKTFLRSEALLVDRFADPEFASVRQYIRAYYPKPDERMAFHARGGVYIDERAAEVQIDSALVIITRLEAAGRNPLHVLNLDIKPLGARVELQSLGGEPLPGIANHPITGLWLGEYDYVVTINNVVRARGIVDLIGKSERTLWCRFDVPQFASSGCVQQ
jgi:hypothetical protein